MIRNLCLAFALLSGLSKAQDVIFSERFDTDDPNHYNDWVILDDDRDGETWKLSLGSDFAESAGWDNTNSFMMVATSYISRPIPGPLDADDVLISPEITIPATGKTELSYKIGVVLDERNGFKLNDIDYWLFILADGQKYFPTLTPTDHTNFSSANSAQERKFDISAYKGKKIRLCFRHRAFAQFQLLLDNIKITHQPDLSVSDTPNKEEIIYSVYPNPAYDVLHLQGFGSSSSYIIYDASGKAVNKGNGEEHINLRALPAGAYIIKVKNNEVEKTFKFIKK